MSKDRGFTLLEVLVAFTIAALAFSVMVQVAGNGLGSVHTAGRYEEAVSRAESHLAAIGRYVAMTPGELKGDDGGGFKWRVLVEPVAVSKLPSQDDNGAAQAAPPSPISLYRVAVAVSWNEGGRTRQVELRTQRLGQTEHGSSD